MAFIDHPHAPPSCNPPPRHHIHPTRVTHDAKVLGSTSRFGRFQAHVSHGTAFLGRVVSSYSDGVCIGNVWVTLHPTLPTSLAHPTQISNQVNTEEWQFFLKGGAVLDRFGQTPNPSPSWISDEAWDNITEMDHLPHFKGITGAFAQNPGESSSRYSVPEDRVSRLRPPSFGPLGTGSAARSLHSSPHTACLQPAVDNTRGM